MSTSLATSVCNPIGNSPKSHDARLEPVGLNPEGGPNATIIDPLASVAEGIVASLAGIEVLGAW